MTEHLYYDDSYTLTFQARIVERALHDGRPAVVLDRTYFYPTGGGQPHDVGMIVGAAVIDVVTRKPDKAVLHVLDRALEDDLVVVEGEIDWTRRFDHMQQHTGQHILTQAFERTCAAHTVGFHLSDATVTIDLDRTDLTAQQIDLAEALANQVVFENRIVSAAMLSREQLNESIRVRKIPDQLATDGIRIISIDDFDSTACGGTHVTRTGEIGLIKIVRTEKRGDKLRVEFRCGGRALIDYREKTEAVNALATLLTCAPPDMPAAIESLRADLRAAQKAERDAREMLIAQEAAALLAETRIVIRDYPARDGGDLRALAGRIAAAHEDAVALLSASGEKTQFVFARGSNASGDMGAALKLLFAELEGMRGGGSPTLAQGGGGALSHERALEALARAAALLGK